MIWGVRKVFNYFRNLPVMSDLTLKELSLKLAMLLCLVLGSLNVIKVSKLNLKRFLHTVRETKPLVVL